MNCFSTKKNSIVYSDFNFLGNLFYSLDYNIVWIIFRTKNCGTVWFFNENKNQILHLHNISYMDGRICLGLIQILY